MVLGPIGENLLGYNKTVCVREDSNQALFTKASHGHHQIGQQVIAVFAEPSAHKALTSAIMDQLPNADHGPNPIFAFSADLAQLRFRRVCYAGNGAETVQQSGCKSTRVSMQR